MEDLFDQRSVKVAHMIISIAGALGMMGLILALVGLYAVVSYQVGRRTREIGIRVALGAARTQVIALILKETAWMSITGIAIGALGGLSGNHLLSQGMSAAAPSISLSLSAAVILTLFLTTFLAVTIPARRASRVDPLHALRQD
jgi:ABC-type antimicrobial peptide transport system permease subunit